MKSAMVFTDLDGSLLDHHSYSFVAREPALDHLRLASISVVPASSKTAAEILLLRDALGTTDPSG